VLTMTRLRALFLFLHTQKHIKKYTAYWI